MTPLFHHLAAQITRDGPLTVARFMAEALGNRDHGYYITRDPLGGRGDFITAPEISQVFGELIGLWCASVWQTLGSPDCFQWIELGPGRGTLMTDAVRATRSVDGFHRAARIHFVETSPVLVKKQRESLATVGMADCLWHGDISQIPEASLDSLSNGPLIVIANEFFDALPVRQFQRVAAGWRERLIDLTHKKDGLRFVLASRAPKPHFIPAGMEAVRDGDIVETSPLRMRLVHTLAERIKYHGGAALIIDYGHMVSAPGETLQAMQNHAYADILSNPGEQDLTAHVDFQALQNVARAAGVSVAGPVEQGIFLNKLGLPVRSQQLVGAASSVAQAHNTGTGIDRLVNPAHMGRLFKVMGLMSPDLDPLPGFN